MIVVPCSCCLGGVMSPPSLKSGFAPKSFLWTFPECPVRIHVNFDFIDRLRTEALDPAHADSEVGGLLIGNELARTGEVEVSDYVPLPAGSELTKTFSVCSSSLTKVIQSGGTAGKKVIGFYRTHLEPRIQLRLEDLECMRSKFMDPANVFLIIRPHDGRASAGFFFWQDGSVVGGLNFPFSSAELSTPAWTTLVGGSPRHGALGAVLTRTREAVRGLSTGMTIGLVAVLALLIVMAGALIYRPASLTAPAPSPSQTPVLSQTPGMPQNLGLRVERALMGVIVAWNPAATEIAGAKDADLLIWDGPTAPVFVRLTPAQLHAGRAFFNSQSDRVEIRMDIIGQEGKARTESVVSTGAAPEVLIPDHPFTGLGTTATAPRPIPPPAEQKNTASSPAPPVPAAKPARIFTPTAAVPRSTTRPGELPQPPQLEMLDLTPLAQPFHTFNDPQLRDVPAPPTPVREPVAPQPASDTRPQPPAPTVAIRPQPDSFQAAVPVRQVRPQIPADLRAMVHGDNVVEVLVHISDSGTVTTAKLGAVKGTSTGFLSKLALSAALNWQFRPATQNGKPVPSDKILEFLFRPSAR